MRLRPGIILLAVGWATLGLALVEPASAWRQELAGDTGSEADVANAVAVDAAGDVFVGAALDKGDDVLAFVVAKLDATTGAVLWRRDLDGSSGVAQGALAIAVDAAGDVVAAGGLDLDFTVVKLVGTTGAELWRLQIDGTETFETAEEARAVAIDSAGDVVAAGFLNNLGASRDFVVVKVAGASGVELWRHETDGGDGKLDQAAAVAIDGLGDVVAAGRLAGDVAGDDFAVIKLAAATGAELWRQRIDGTDSGDDEALSVAIDSAGDVAAAGVFDNDSTREDFAVVKLASATGTELWRVQLDGDGVGKRTLERATAVAIDAADDVIAAGVTEFIGSAQDVTVVKVAGGSGAQLWRRDIQGDLLIARDEPFAVAVDGLGDVLVAGRVENGPVPHFDFSVIRLSGASGTDVWQQHVDGTSGGGPGVEEVRAIAIDAAGDVIAAGFLENKSTGDDATIVKFEGATGVVGAVSGTKVQLTDKAGKPTKRKLKADLREATFVTPAPGSPDDPGIAGAELRIVNPITLETATFPFPPGPSWRVSTTPLGFRAYIYRDKGVNGPCTVVQASANGVRAVCSGSRGSIPFSLDEPSQGELTVTFQFGTAPVQCGVFGGKISKDAGTASPGPKGTFRAVRALAALGTACP